MAHQGAVHRSNLVSHLDVNNYEVQQTITGFQKTFESKGMTFDQAREAAYQALNGRVEKQAAVLSYMDVFFYLGLLFLICVPFILFVRKRKGKVKIDMSEAMH